MEKILFYTRFFPDPHFGGVERVTRVIGGELRMRGVEVFYTTPQKSSGIAEDGRFFYLDQNPMANLGLLTQFVRENSIRVVVSQYANDPFNELFAQLHKITGIKLITVYHFSPGCERLVSEQALKKPICGEDTVHRMKRYVKLLLGKFYIEGISKRVLKRIQYAYNESDLFILLSERFKQSFIDSYDINPCGEKLKFIANPLSFPVSEVIVQLEEKQKVVLIVARHEEQKRLFLALDIWGKIEKKGHEDWKLVLVGEGEYTQQYKLYTRKLGLKRVIFEGKQNPLPYYKQATIFMMTSLYEGFGMTLTEAQQHGVVPIVFDSYASLHDIVEHSKTGIVVPNDDVEQYVKDLEGLMNNEEIRTRMAQQAMESCKKFSINNIVDEWQELFES